MIAISTLQYVVRCEDGNGVMETSNSCSDVGKRLTILQMSESNILLYYIGFREMKNPQLKKILIHIQSDS
jgi:hypothetical protein